MTDSITVAQWNVENDGGDTAGERWDHAHDILNDHRPDILLRQEAKHSRERGSRRLHAAEQRLGLRGFLSAANPEADADIATAVFIRPELFTVVEARPRCKPWWLHPCHLLVRLGNCPVPLNLVSFHMCWFDAGLRLTEARWLTTLAQPGMVTLAGGDTNSYPKRRDPEITLPDWTKVSDRSHLAHRTFVDGIGHHSDTRPDAVLTTAGYVDLARHAADHLDQPGALAPTGGKHAQGGPQRIDRAYLAGGLADALEAAEVIDTHETRAVSDHALLIYRFHRGKLDRLLRQQVATAAAH